MPLHMNVSACPVGKRYIGTGARLYCDRGGRPIPMAGARGLPDHRLLSRNSPGASGRTKPRTAAAVRAADPSRERLPLIHTGKLGSARTPREYIFMYRSSRARMPPFPSRSGNSKRPRTRSRLPCMSGSCEAPLFDEAPLFSEAHSAAARARARVRPGGCAGRQISPGAAQAGAGSPHTAIPESPAG